MLMGIRHVVGSTCGIYAIASEELAPEVQRILTTKCHRTHWSLPLTPGPRSMQQSALIKSDGKGWETQTGAPRAARHVRKRTRLAA